VTWNCPKCQESVDSQLDCCWNCGTTPDGVEDPTFCRADTMADEGDEALDLSELAKASDQDQPSRLPLVRFRFSLRTLMIGVTLLCVVLGGVMWYRLRNDTAGLYRTVYAGNTRDLAFRLRLGADPNAKDDPWRHESLLHVAVSNNDVESAALLIEYGADVNAVDNYGQSALLMARQGNIVEVLLENGADVHAKDADGHSALHEVAADSDDPRAVQLLLQHGADVNVRTESGATPLHMAMDRANPEIVEALLDGGADPNAKTDEGSAPLHIVVVGLRIDTGKKFFDTKPTIRLLVERGADVNAMDAEGATPLQIAELFSEAFPELLDNTALIRLLQELGAKRGSWSALPSGEDQPVTP